jgi:hypothetical protein
VPASAIPIAVLGTFVFMQACGFTLNILTMFGLILVIGSLVDDAIVVVENTQSIMAREGIGAKEAAKKSPAKQKDSDMRNEVNNEIQKRLSKEGIPGDIINSTASFVSKNIGKDGYKQTIYRGIIKDHGQKQGLAIYRLIKDIL